MIEEIKWRPIETAPRDGVLIIANKLGEVCPCKVKDGTRLIYNTPGFADWSFGEVATHWMPLPPAPEGI